MNTITPSVTRLKKHAPLILIMGLALVLRVFWLDKFPNTISDDELEYAFTAQSYFRTGKDILGETNPFNLLTFSYPSYEFKKAEIPYVILAPFVGPQKLSLLSVRLPGALFNTALVLIIYLMTKKLLDKKTALITAIVAAINPYYIWIGRTVYDSPFAILFYLAGFYILISRKRWRLLLAVPFFYLGFYSYIGTKLIFLPLVFLSCLFAYRSIHGKNYGRQFIVVFLSATALTAFYGYTLLTAQEGSRTAELLLPTSDVVTKQVNLMRHDTISTPFTPLFENKATVYTRMIATRFLKIFSTDYLFLFGDNFFLIWRHGLFYYIDAVFMLIGFAVLANRNKTLTLFAGAMIVVGTAPQVFHRLTEGNMAPHISLLFPFLFIFIAVGIVQTLRTADQIGRSRIAVSMLTALYVLQLANFLHIYFFFYPLKGYYDLDDRLISSYIERVRQTDDHPVTVATTAPQLSIRRHLFYTGYLQNHSTKELGPFLTGEKLTVNNVTFRNCINTPDELEENRVTIVDINCMPEIGQDHLSFSDLNSAGELHQIYNDPICHHYPLMTYPQHIRAQDFDLESLPTDQFCQKFVVDAF